MLCNTVLDITHFDIVGSIPGFSRLSDESLNRGPVSV